MPPGPPGTPGPGDRPQPSGALRAVAITGAVLAVAALGAGLGLDLAIGPDFEERKTLCMSRQCVPADWADLAGRQQTAYAVLAVGGALAVADIVVWIVDGRRRSVDRRVTLAPLPLGLSLQGSF